MAPEIIVRRQGVVHQRWELSGEDMNLVRQLPEEISTMEEALTILHGGIVEGDLFEGLPELSELHWWFTHLVELIAHWDAMYIPWAIRFPQG